MVIQVFLKLSSEVQLSRMLKNVDCKEKGSKHTMQSLVGSPDQLLH